MAIAKTGLRYT